MDHVTLTPELLLNAYANGVFPMAEGRDDDRVFWVDPTDRGIIPLDGFHISRSLAKCIRSGQFEVRFDTAFEDVVEACADREETWINDEIFRLYSQLHHLGFCHSVEVYKAGALVGGAYGVALAGAFFGESMFSRCANASKVALAYLVARLRATGFVLLDTQFITPHLTSLGATEIPRDAYRALLEDALSVRGDFGALKAPLTAQDVLQTKGQTS